MVLSESMEPVLKMGGLTGVQPVDPYKIKEGDIITYKFPEMVPISHRVIEILDSEDELGFRTKGDANEDPDNKVIYPENVLGTVRFYIPYVGYLANFIKTRLGTLLLVLLPGAMIISTEVKNVFTPASRWSTARRHRKMSHTAEAICVVGAVAAIIILGGFMAQNSQAKIIEYEVDGETTPNQVISQRDIKNGSPVPFLVCLYTDIADISFSDNQFLLGSGERKTVDVILSEEIMGSGRVSYRSGCFIPLLPEGVIYSLGAWNLTVAPFIIAAIPVVPLAVFVFLLFRKTSSKRRKGWRKT